MLPTHSTLPPSVLAARTELLRGRRMGDLGWGWGQSWGESSQGWVDGAMVGVKEAKWDQSQGGQDQGQQGTQPGSA